MTDIVGRHNLCKAFIAVHIQFHLEMNWFIKGVEYVVVNLFNCKQSGEFGL